MSSRSKGCALIERELTGKQGSGLNATTVPCNNMQPVTQRELLGPVPPSTRLLPTSFCRRLLLLLHQCNGSRSRAHDDRGPGNRRRNQSCDSLFISGERRRHKARHAPATRAQPRVALLRQEQRTDAAATVMMPSMNDGQADSGQRALLHLLLLLLLLTP